eukprot:GDKH01003135.1.p3 GENE.GDKH01003135.1~~GDKH01003135.1.p3  ORF type:complete len:70 (+),score=8.64 GDKH01003135.1:92-301(+)
MHAAPPHAICGPAAVPITENARQQVKRHHNNSQRRVHGQRRALRGAAGGYTPQPQLPVKALWTLKIAAV